MNLDRKNNSSKKMLHILLVEDEPILRKATHFLLEGMGHQVDLAINGKTAIEKFAHGYDVIFMDIRMPEMDGFETTKALRQLETNDQHAIIIALTAEDAGIKEQCIAAGMNAFIQKPFDMNKLERLLQKIHTLNNHSIEHIL